MSYRGFNNNNNNRQDVDAEVQSLKEQVEQMKLLVNDHAHLLELENEKKKSKNEASIINGSFLSIIFLVVFIMILAVSGYAFKNLITAIVKKFNPTHTEL